MWLARETRIGYGGLSMVVNIPIGIFRSVVAVMCR